jgi:hypothetical protein
MRLPAAASLVLACAGCAAPARLEPSAQTSVAVVRDAYEQRLNAFQTIRLRAGQILLPSRADGRDEFCATNGVVFSPTGNPPPIRLCFSDPASAGRLTLGHFVYATRAEGLEVSVPYSLQPFADRVGGPPICGGIIGCGRNNPDLTAVRDPQQMAERSIAPPDIRPFVQLSLANSPDLEPSIRRVAESRAAGRGPDAVTAEAARISAMTAVATREVRDRRAQAICGGQNPGPAAGFMGLIGNIAVIIGGLSERSCWEEYERTGVMPEPPPPVPHTPN